MKFIVILIALMLSGCTTIAERNVHRACNGASIWSMSPDWCAKHPTALNDNSRNIPAFMFAVPGGFIPGYGEVGGYGEGIQLQGKSPTQEMPANHYCPQHLVCTPKRLG